ncbi:MAG: InlB B-repeat-containing protein, partial [Eubacteriales bacterium]|nr:InlB B-repeat-containing protein [Eubacteriales bacterium]
TQEEPQQNPDESQDGEAEEEEESTPTKAPVYFGSEPSPISITPDGAFVSAGETVTLTIGKTGTVNNITVELADKTLGSCSYDEVSTVTFTAYPGVTGAAVITVSGTNESGEPVTSATATVNVAHKYNVKFSDVNDTSKNYTGDSYVYGGQTYRFAPVGEDYYLFEYEWKTYTSEELTVSDPYADGYFRINVPPVITPTAPAPENTLMIELSGSVERQFSITPDTSEASAACDTLHSETSTARYMQEEPFVIEIRHEEYKKPEEGAESGATPEDNYVYSMPMIKIKDKNGLEQDYFGFWLETVTDDPEYSKMWKLYIPGEDITGDMIVYADKTKLEEDDEETKDIDETTVVRSISFIGSSESTKEENIPELSVISNLALDAGEGKAKDYYFSVKNGAIPKKVEYSVGGGEPVALEPVEGSECIYKIEKEAITADIVVSVYDPNVFSVTKQGSGKGEETLIELSQDYAAVGQDYTFRVKHHEKAIYNDFKLWVTINGIDYYLGRASEITITRSGDYWNVTIPASMVINDIVITGECATAVKCSVIFEDAYYAAEQYLNYRFTAFKIVLVTKKDGIITRTLLDSYIKPETRNIAVEVVPYEELWFEVACPSTNSAGKYYTDPNIDCYVYNFIGSKMAATELGTMEYIQDNYVYLFPYETFTESDGTFHQDYYVGQVKGDTVIKVKPLMKKFGVSVTGDEKDLITMDKTYASYRSNFKFTNTAPGLIKVKSITIGGKVISENAGYTVSEGVSKKEYTITGGYIKGDVVITTEYVNKKTEPQESGTYVTPNTYTKETVSSSGTEYELDISSFRRLNNGYYIYLITAAGTPADKMAPCYDGHEMIYYEPYDSYVWLVISNENGDDFYMNIDDLFDELGTDELDMLRQNRVKSGKSTEEEENELLNAIEGFTVAGDLNGDGIVDEKDIEIARDMYMNTDPADKSGSLSLHLLADVNCSRTLDMKDVAMIRRLAKNDAPDTEEERAYTLELSADGEHKITAKQDDEITVELKLIRTDKNEDDDAAVSCIQDEIHFDGKLFELLEDSELADGVAMSTFKEVTDDRKEDVRCISVSYVETDDAVKLGKETVLAVFKLKVLDDDVASVMSHNDAFVIALDAETVYSCRLTDLTIESEKIQPPMYVVTFNYMGAAQDDVVEVIEGSLINPPLLLPDYEGHIFAGWYADEGYTELWDFENGVAEEDMTLYAKWDEIDTFNPIWLAVIAVALLAAGGAGILIYRRRYY